MRLLVSSLLGPSHFIFARQLVIVVKAVILMTGLHWETLALQCLIAGLQWRMLYDAFGVFEWPYWIIPILQLVLFGVHYASNPGFLWSDLDALSHTGCCDGDSCCAI